MAHNKEDFISKQSEEVAALSEQIQDRERIIKEYRKEHGRLEVFFRQVRDQISPLQPVIYKPEIIGKPIGARVVSVMHVTDTHMGAVQQPSEIEDFGEYNPQITTERCLDFARRHVTWANNHKNVYNLNEVVVLFTGDLISGDIHDELKVTNEFPSPVQVVRAAEVHAQQLMILAQNFDKVTAHFITEDNHSRLTKKPQAKEAGMNSMNYLVGEMIKAYISQQPNITFNIYPMLETVVDVNNQLYLITHGHSIRGWMGVPWYGVERKVGREAQARLQLIMADIERAKTIGFHKYIFGHFHTPFDSILYACGGSLQGTDAYDHQAGRYSKPCQSSWMVHEKHGEFNRINFYF